MLHVIKRKAKIREIVSSCIILLAVLLIGCRLRVGWVVGLIGGTTRLTVMVQDRRWWYVGLDICFLILDVDMFGAWSGWWPNHVRVFVLQLFPWLF